MKTTALTIFFASIASLAFAGKLSVDFGFFPEGTDCQVYGNDVKLSKNVKKDEIEFNLKGNTASVFFECSIPDGRAFFVRPSQLGVPDARYVALQVNADGYAHVLWDAGAGLSRKTIPNALEWKP